MDYDLGYFDVESWVLEPVESPFGPKVLPMSWVHCLTHVPGLDRKILVDVRGFEPLTPCLQSARVASNTHLVYF